jgi:hypothetical protein
VCIFSHEDLLHPATRTIFVSVSEMRRHATVGTRANTRDSSIWKFRQFVSPGSLGSGVAVEVIELPLAGVCTLLAFNKEAWRGRIIIEAQCRRT